MLRLHSGTGSSEIQLVRRVDDTEFQPKKRQAIRILRESDETEACKTLESQPWEMWEGTNGFGDEFGLLYRRARTSEYLELEDQVDEGKAPWPYRAVARAFEKIGLYVRFIAVDIDPDPDENQISVVAQPTLRITSAVVERALTDAEILIRENGAVSGLDRIHTAFHGYLKAVADDAHLSITKRDPSVGDLYKTIRSQHPTFAHPVSGGSDIGNILNSLGAIVHATSPLRNQGSMAHANKNLLEEPEAMLTINAIRSMLHYLDAKINSA